MASSGYRLVQLANGAWSVHSLAHRETFHPVIGPVAEAEALYVKQLRLCDRLRAHQGEFVVWDVGLGAAANALTVLRAARDIPCTIRLDSFDHTIQPLCFALNHAAALDYFGDYQGCVQHLVPHHRVSFARGRQTVEWQLHLADFPALLASARTALPRPVRNERGEGRGEGRPTADTQALLLSAGQPASLNIQHSTSNIEHPTDPNAPRELGVGGSMLDVEGSSTAPPDRTSIPQSAPLPAPHAILFDAFSPARNPAMWTQPLFADLFKHLDPQRPCAMPTYSRSTMLRVSLLLAGFFVGAGHATGEKEETTIAANTLDLITEPLDRKWLARARRSTSAEPLWEPVYRQAKMSDTTWEKLQNHPQFG